MSRPQPYARSRHGEEGAFAAFIGIDWADKKHDVCLWVPGQAKRERLVLEHRPRAIQTWAEQLRERFAGARVAVRIELAQGPIVSALLEHDFFVLFPVQPTTVARYRSAFTPSGAKDDPTDAEVVLELLLRHRDKLKPLHSDDAVTVPARMLVDALLPQLRALSASIVRFDEEIARLAPQLPDYELFAALPGAGPTLAPRLLAAARAVSRRRRATEIRRHRARHRAQRKQVLGPLALQLQQVPAPDHSSNGQLKPSRAPSGQKPSTTPTALGGARHQAALRALAFKWIRILHRCWLDRVPYDESRNLMALPAPLLKHAAQSSGCFFFAVRLRA
jgi:hypothetical protein